MTKIATHDGQFHLDEVLAVHMLKNLPEFKDATIVRTRDKAKYDECNIVVDVGHQFAPPKYFDHHHPEFKEYFTPRHHLTKLSSAGLIYKYYGREVLAQILDLPESSKTIEAIYPRIYNNFIQLIDAQDNGVDLNNGYQPRVSQASLSLGVTVSNLNPSFGDDRSDENLTKQFFKAVNLAGTAFDALVRYQGLGWYPAKDIVVRALKARFSVDSSGKIIELSKDAPFKSHLYSQERDYQTIYYVIFPSNGRYRVMAVPKSGSVLSRRPLPVSWRGLEDEKLSQASGIPGCTFVHSTGFIGENTSRDGALAMAQKALVMV